MRSDDTHADNPLACGLAGQALDAL